MKKYFFFDIDGTLLTGVPGNQYAPASALAALKRHPLGQNAALIGRAEAGRPLVTLTTTIGARRILDLPEGEQLPRIC